MYLFSDGFTDGNYPQNLRSVFNTFLEFSSTLINIFQINTNLDFDTGAMFGPKLSPCLLLTLVLVFHLILFLPTQGEIIPNYKKGPF